MEDIRSFIAIELSEEIRLVLAQLQEHLKQDSRNVKWVDVSGIHLTLKFLGNVTEDRLDTDAVQLLIAFEGPFQRLQLHVMQDIVLVKGEHFLDRLGFC